ncbi:MAG: C45 family peptidase [Clostridiales bacterium]|nr:C45 family peptidase [Clostridiales bacterium]
MKKTITARTMTLSGSSYEIGRQLGGIAAGIPALKNLHTTPVEGFDAEAVRGARELFKRWCPGLNEELEGFADALDAPVDRILFYGMTYLKPNCSHAAVLPSLTESGAPLLARNYEFHQEMEDFSLVKTCIAGKYTHLGTSVLFFGRDDGFNEHGLAVTMSSTGFPVGPLDDMRKPALIGFQFWAATRAVLENCKDVAEALAYLADMPIAFNMNLLLADKTAGALFSTFDGHKAVTRIDQTTEEQYLCAANHPLQPELVAIEPTAMKHSVVRYDWLCKKLDGKKNITKEYLKELLLSMYPEGLCCHYFNDFFGTTKSMVIDPKNGIIDLCWGGQAKNGWDSFDIKNPLPPSEKQIELNIVGFPQESMAYVPLV